MSHYRYHTVEAWLMRWVTPEDRGHLSPCWIWQGTCNRKGYATAFPPMLLRTGLYSGAAVHRHTYEWFVGPIPEGLVIDHLCRVRSCVNPHHLEPVTQAENIRRGDWPAMIRARRERTHCFHGHEFTVENTRSKEGRGRACRTCEREQRRLRDAIRRKNQHDAMFKRRNRARRTHCMRGHELTPENRYVRPDGDGSMCRICQRERMARRNQLIVKSQRKSTPQAPAEAA